MSEGMTIRAGRDSPAGLTGQAAAGDPAVKRPGRNGASPAGTGPPGPPSTSAVISPARCAPRVTPLWVTATYTPSTPGSQPTMDRPSAGMGRTHTRYPVTAAPSSPPVTRRARSSSSPAQRRSSSPGVCRSTAASGASRCTRPPAWGRRYTSGACTTRTGPEGATGPAWTTSPGAAAPGSSHGTSGIGAAAPAGPAAPASAARRGTWMPAQHTTTSAGMSRPAAVRTPQRPPATGTSKPVTRPGSPVSTLAPCAAAWSSRWLIIVSVSRYPSLGNQATPVTARGRRSDGSSSAASAALIRRAGYPHRVSLRTRAASSVCPAAPAAHSRFPTGRCHAAPPRPAASCSQARIPATFRSW